MSLNVVFETLANAVNSACFKALTCTIVWPAIIQSRGFSLNSVTRIPGPASFSRLAFTSQSA